MSGQQTPLLTHLSAACRASGMPRRSGVLAIGFSHHPTQRANYQECSSEDKDGLRQYL